MNKSFVFIAGLLFIILAFVAACAPSPTPTVPVATAQTAQQTVVPNAPAATATTAQQTTVPNAPPDSTATAVPSNSDAEPTTASTTFNKINLNTASPEQILTIPNTGNRMVREFQEYRPYTTILQFRREIGKYVDQATVAGYEQYVYVPVDINQADAATIQQIPGVTADVAAQLIAARPYADANAFLTKLTSLAAGVDSAMAQNYLAQ